MLRLLADTSVWLDLARRRDGQKWIAPLTGLVEEGDVELLVPEVLLAEYSRNRGRVEAAMSSGVAERFKLLRRDIVNYGGEDRDEALSFIDGLAHQIPLIGAMTTLNFDLILELLQKGRRLEPGPAEHEAVVRRGLDKRAPLHRHKNSVADALLVELYASAVAAGDLEGDRFAFATSNHEDFSATGTDRRRPHPDIEDVFAADGSTYRLGVEGLVEVLDEEFTDVFEELVDAADFVEEPRRLDEILQAEQEFFDRVWHERHLVSMMKIEAGDEAPYAPDILKGARANAERVRKRWPDVRPVESNFEWGLWNGKLSALRWVLGSEWDFLDT